MIFDGSSCFEPESLPDRVQENVIIVSSSFPHRKPTQTHVLENLALLSKRAGIVVRYHHAGGLVVDYGLYTGVVRFMKLLLMSRENIPSASMYCTDDRSLSLGSLSSSRTHPSPGPETSTRPPGLSWYHTRLSLGHHPTHHP
jgi:hypothetical protein